MTQETGFIKSIYRLSSVTLTKYPNSIDIKQFALLNCLAYTGAEDDFQMQADRHTPRRSLSYYIPTIRLMDHQLYSDLFFPEARKQSNNQYDSLSGSTKETLWIPRSHLTYIVSRRNVT